jgi:aerotaxis receptor
MRNNLPVTNDEYVLPDGEVIISRTDIKGRVTYVNESFVQSSGFSREEAMGKAHNIVRHPDMPPVAFEDLWNTIKEGEPWSALVKNRRKDGGFYWVRANVTPMVENGQISGYMSVRTKPGRAEVAAAEELYRKMREGQALGIMLKGGEIRRLGVRGMLQGLGRLSLTARSLWAAGGLAVLYAAIGALALAAPDKGRTAIALLGALGALLSIIWGLRLTSRLSAPIAEAIAVARRAAGGDAALQFPDKGDPELLHLFRMLDQMNGKMVGVLKDVHASMSTVNGAAGEIAAGNLDLSRRTEEQAASLEETASSMEELTSTVKQNAENARQANHLALGASSVAVKGGKVVGDVVGTMSSINESSRKIVDIISVIDGIAFQTNILALNAAVEAARAGEQGRGFAVVATEVRNLAQRSAAAAKEIKTLIGDSVEKVGVGTKLVDDAGKTMEEIVASVKRVTDIMSEITSASEEQSQGIEQVNQAITHMDQVTQQNAGLVEEAAAAAELLRSQVLVVDEAMVAFRLGQDRKHAAAVARAGAPKAVPTRRALALETA